MTRITAITFAVVLGVAGVAFAQDAPKTDATPAIDPKAMEALDNMGKALRAMGPYTLHADSSAELVLEDGEKVEFGGTVDYKVKPPDGLYAHLKSDRRDREYFYDGKTFTIYAPKSKYFATLPAPPTLRALVDKAEGEYGLEMPLADLFVWGSDQAPTKEITRATFVGPAFLGTTPVAHYAFRQGDVDWQVWIDRDAMPRKLSIVDVSIPERPAYRATLEWTKGASIAPDAFAFKPATDAYEIEFFPGTVAAANGGGQ
jgi:hypothetical protein